MIVGRCYVCDAEIDSMHPHAYRVVGWEAVRGGGGANRIIDRVRLRDGTVIAHTTCVERVARNRRNGIADTQETLL